MPSSAASATTVTRITLRQPDDWHLHLRDGAVLRDVVGHTARQFGRAIIMPNLVPPVVTTAQAQQYRDRIMQALHARGTLRQYDSSDMDPVDVGKAVAGAAGGSAATNEEVHDDFRPLMTLYLTDNTTADEVRRARDSGFVHAVKLYPAGATTNSDAGVTDLLGRCAGALEAMEEVGMPLLVHGEVTDPNVDVFDREAVFIDRVMIPLRHAFPDLKVVFEHLTTREGVAYVRDAQGPVAATITAHHLLYNRNALFQGGLQPHYYCLPVLKREPHRQALLEAATSGSGRFFLGTDSAPHAQGAKEAACGCAGCYTALHAMELYATAFESVGRLDALEAFASLNGPAFYGLPVNTRRVQMVRRPLTIPDSLPLGDASVIPLDAGGQLPWSWEGLV